MNNGMFTTSQRCSDFATIHSRVRLVSRSSSQSAPARIPCVCFPQLVDSLVRAMEFVTLRAGGREGSAVFFATEQLVCVCATASEDSAPPRDWNFRARCRASRPDWPAAPRVSWQSLRVSVVSRLRPPFCANRLFVPPSVWSFVLHRGVKGPAYQPGPRRCPSSSQVLQRLAKTKPPGFARFCSCADAQGMWHVEGAVRVDLSAGNGTSIFTKAGI